MDDKDRAKELLLACGMFEEKARRASRQYSFERIRSVCDYVINELKYERPATAIWSALREAWEVPIYDPDKVAEILNSPAEIGQEGSNEQAQSNSTR